MNTIMTAVSIAALAASVLPADPGFRTFQSRSDFLSQVGPTRLITFDQDPDTAITPMPNGTGLQYRGFYGVCFENVLQSGASTPTGPRFLYSNPNTPLRITLPHNTYAVAFDLAPHDLIPGEFTITLSTGQGPILLATPPVEGSTQTNFFGIYSATLLTQITVTHNTSAPTIDNLLINASSGSVGCPRGVFITAVAPTLGVLPSINQMIPIKIAAPHLGGGTCQIWGVSSSDPSAPSLDWNITGSMAISLRATSTNPNVARYYTIGVLCSAPGSSATGMTTVVIPAMPPVN